MKPGSDVSRKETKTMKKRRMIALILAGALLAGQTVYAQEMTPMQESVDTESEEISDDVKNPQEISADQEEVQIEESVHSEQNVMAGSNDENQSKISETGESIEKEFTGDSVQSNVLDDEVMIKDEHLRAYLMKQSYYDENEGKYVRFGDDGYISVSEMESLTRLNIYENIKISDLSGLEYAVNLEGLAFYSGDLSELTSIEPLRGLWKLSYLTISGTDLTDISALENLTELSHLDLSFSGISDISVLKNKTELSKLNLSNTAISDVSALSDLSNIFSLSLANTDISDISALSNMTKLWELDLSSTKISDVSSLSGLFGLSELNLQNCKELSTIEPIYNNLSEGIIYDIDIRGTSIPDEDRLDILYKNKIPPKFVVGDGVIDLSDVNNYFNENSIFSVQAENVTNKCLNVTDNMIYIENSGTAILKWCLNETVKEYSVEVLEVPDETTVLGDSVDYTLEIIKDKKTGGNTATILTSNGELWNLYPEGKFVRKNVKDYVSDWVYSRTDRVHKEYALDYDGVLWSGDTKIEENIKRFDGHYALNTDNVLIDIYNDQSVKVEAVKDWIEVVSWITDSENPEKQIRCTIPYVLKQDGSLWTRMEVEKSRPVNQFQKIAENVEKLYDDYYLSTDGVFYTYDGTEIENPFSYSFDEEGNLLLWGDIAGKYNIQEFYDYESSNHIFFLTEEGNFYYFEGGREGIASGEILLSDVEKVNYDKDRKYICKTEDNIYYRVDSNAEVTRVYEYCISQMTDSDGERNFLYNYIFDTQTGDKYIERNGTKLLDHVDIAWEYGIPGELKSSVFAIRTDGTVWTFENRLPVKIVDLNDKGIEKGNLNGDESVNVVDLMMCLHFVSGRETFTGEASMAADINDDGIVNVVDLMRMLHYVSGRSTTL